MHKNIEKIFLLSDALKGILYQHLAGTGDIYTEIVCLKFDQCPDMERLRAAWQKVVDNNRILRSYVQWERVSAPVLIMARHKTVSIELRRGPGDIDQVLREERAKGVRIDREAMRLVLYTTEADGAYMLMISHHIFLDGWSTGVVLDEWHRAFHGEDIDKALDYDAYLQYLKDKDTSRCEQFWSRQLKDYSGVMDLPRELGSDSCRELSRPVPDSLREALRGAAERYGTTLSTLVLAVWAAFLSEYNDTVVDFGVASSGRQCGDRDFNQVVGLFINVYPFHLPVNRTLSVSDWIQRVIEVQAVSLDNADMPFPTIKARIGRNIREFNTLLAVENYPVNPQALRDAALIRVSEDTHYDLVMQLHLYDRWQVKMLSGQAGRADLPCTMDRFFELLHVFTSCEPTVAFSSLCTSRYVQLKVYTPFDPAYLHQAISLWVDGMGHSYKASCSDIRILGGREEISEKAVSHIFVGLEYMLEGALGFPRSDRILSAFANRLKQYLENRADQTIFLYSLQGLFINKVDKESARVLDGYYRQIEQMTVTYPHVTLLRLVDLPMLGGERELFDRAAYQQANMPFQKDVFYDLAVLVCRKSWAAFFNEFKLLILDCDNTLWKGICAEDGWSGIQVTREHAAFQQFLLDKKSQGFLLALCSKNQEDDVRRVFEKSPGMLLSYEDFISKRINWNSKSDNIRDICRELSLDESSVIFMDDSVAECAGCLMELPRALTLLMPSEERDLMPFIGRIWAFDRIRVTNEDKNRHQMYLENKQRERLRETHSNDGDLLKFLNLEIRLSPLTRSSWDRVSQLSLRTNQCNLNGRRLSVHELVQQSPEENYVIRADDLYGSYGIVGYVSWQVQGKTANIRHFFLSCRVLSRYVEHKIFNYLLDLFHNASIETCVTQCVLTGKNKYFVEFLKNTGWSVQQQNDSLNCFRPTCRRIAFASEECIGIQRVPENEETCRPEPMNAVEPGAHRGERKSSGGPAPEERPFLYHWKEELLELAKLGRTYDFLCPVPALSGGDGLDGAGEIGQETALESRLKGVWNSILPCPLQARTDDFFACGGNSLQALELVSHIYREFGCLINLSDVLKGSAFCQIASQVAHALDTGFDGSAPVPTDKIEYAVPVFAQRIFTSHQSEAGTMYNMPYAFEIKGPLDREKLEQAFESVVRHNRIFRSRFVMKNGNPAALIDEVSSFQVAFVRWDGMLADMELKSLVRPFHLEEGSLIRVVLLCAEGGDTHILFIDFHHLIMDARSLVLVMEQFMAAYRGEAAAFPEIDYFDYAEWFSRGARDRGDREYWIKKLAGAPFTLPFPQGSRGSEESAQTGRCRVDFALAQELTERLRKAAADCAVSLYAFMAACYFLFLYRLTGCSDISIGVPVDMRDSPAAEKIPGMLVNTLVLRQRIEEDKSYQLFAQDIFESIKEMLAHKACMYQDVVEAIRQSGEAVRELYNTMFVFQEYDFPELDLQGCTTRRLPVNPETAQNTLSWECIAGPLGFACNLTYDNTVLSQSAVQRYVGLLVDMLQEACRDIRQKVAHSQCLFRSDFEKILEFEQGSVRPRIPQTLHGLFEKQARLRPNAPCLITPLHSYTYEQVNQAANEAANQLRGVVGLGDCVMVDCGNSLFETILSMLAILKCGCVYLPVGADLPLERKEAIIAHCRVRLIVTKGGAGQELPVFYPDFTRQTGCTNPNCPADPQASAYIIYTSGTTGSSKGVRVSHASITNTIQARVEEYGLSDRDTAMLLMLPQFDGFMTSVFTPLASGAALVVPESLYDAGRLAEALVRHEATHLIATPTLYRSLLESPEFRRAQALRTAVLAGEAISPTLVEDSHRLLPETEIANEYGPTENSVLSTVKRRVTPEDITVGRPIPNIRVRIVDEQGRLCPFGVAGELCLAGAGLAEGYESDQAMTKLKFVEGLCGDGLRWYKTGDLAYWREDGEIVVSGRNDQQIKYRGYRLDLLEIRNAANAVPEVRDCWVVHEKTTGRLLCYYVAGRLIPRPYFIEELRKNLPLYMLPDTYIRISRLPVNANGKLDEKRLTDFSMEAPKTSTQGKETAVRILEDFKVILSREDLTVTDSFFAAGGNSLKAVALLNRLQEQWDADMSIADIFTYSTPEELGGWLDSRQRGKSVSAPRRTKAKLLNDGAARSVYQYAQNTKAALSELFVAMAFYAFSLVDKKGDFPVYAWQGDALHRLDFDFRRDVETEEYIHHIGYACRAKDTITQWTPDRMRGAAVIASQPVYGPEFDALPVLIYSQRTEDSWRFVLEYNPECLCEEAADGFLETLAQFYTSL